MIDQTARQLATSGRTYHPQLPDALSRAAQGEWAGEQDPFACSRCLMFCALLWRYNTTSMVPVV